MSVPLDRDRCREIFASVSEYLDGELPPDTCRELESHLDECPSCVEFVQSLRRTVDLCRPYAPSELPPPLRETARQQLREAYGKMLRARASDSPA